MEGKVGYVTMTCLGVSGMGTDSSVPCCISKVTLSEVWTRVRVREINSL